jgi:hypothetical protein
MAAAPQSAMDKAELRKLLSLSKKEPVNCAIGVGKGPDPLILLHKTKQPRAVLQEMEKEFGVLKTPCWGSAFVDIDANPKLVVLTLNKGVSGMARKLVKSLKGTGFSKIEIKLEDGSVFESVGDEEPDEAEGGEAETTDRQEEAPPPPAPPPPPVDLAGLRGELAALIPQIPAAAGKDPAKLETLKKLAGAANAAVKSGDAEVATAALGELRAALGGGSAPSPTPSPAPEQKSGEFVTMQKSRLIWDSARKRVAAEIGGLKEAVRKEFEGDPEETQALDALEQLDEVMSKFDERLIDTLDEMLNEADPAKRAELREDAKELIGEYSAYANSDPLIKQLDGDTPLGVKLSIASTMTATLKALQASLR